MKHFWLLPFLPLTLMLTQGWAQESELDDVIIPGKTEVFISLQRSLNSKTARHGDKFSAIVEVPVTIEDRVVIPVGSFIIGHVEDQKKAGHLKGKSQLLLAFDTLILPGGTTRKMQAVVQSAERYQTDTAGEEGRIQGSGNQAEEVAVGSAGGAVTGAITGATVGLFRGKALKGAGVGAAIGATGGAIISLLAKGEEVELPKGSSLTIQLQDPVKFVRPAPPAQGEPLEP